LLQVAVTCVARGVKHDGNFGAFLDAMCDKVFGATQLVLVALNIVAPEAAGMFDSIDHFALAPGEGGAGVFTVWWGVMGYSHETDTLTLVQSSVMAKPSSCLRTSLTEFINKLKGSGFKI
jgi:hypothetical protein